MAAPRDTVRDTALLRFLEAHGVADRVSSGRPFVAPVGAPAAARRRREAANVIRLGGYYRLAIRRRDDGALQAGLLHGRRPDLADATFVDDGARSLRTADDLRAVCAHLVGLVEAPRRGPGAHRPTARRGGPSLRLRLRRLTLRGD